MIVVIVNMFATPLTVGQLNVLVIMMMAMY